MVDLINSFLRARRGNTIERVSLPPPSYSGPKQPSRYSSFQVAPTFEKRETSRLTSFQGAPTYEKMDISPNTNYHGTSTSDNNVSVTV